MGLVMEYSYNFNPEGKTQDLADFNITNLIELKKIL